MNELLFKANKVYPQLSTHFQSLIENPESQFAQSTYVTVLPSEDGSLFIEVFGKTIEISFSMVLSETRDFYGQVTSRLIKKPDSYLTSELNIHSIWFDTLGNVKKDLSETTSMEHIRDDRFLRGFIEQSLAQLLASEEFQPASNG
ncbi:hypothetical protein RB979_001386 [Vibrio alginolyticus]|uniref:hypothetical protein n=1 Tax=Vibrio TaxID=662 RepID=UPI001BD48A5D|nr:MULTISPECIES: hypothetical protein [Vibrio]ELA6645888.1 hypothetical protein [Vibrio alginolyticus]ELA6779167.1 hypothetical protein [Vibrio alginolyticus]MBS9910073.1 hypothetical protein [Vibrio alginolyticus]MBT0047676.1 hypothetical protein [Vibrio alginolyticus]MBT0061612.1 hypothetical protein [Vibrio alginolyticus]